MFLFRLIGPVTRSKLSLFEHFIISDIMLSRSSAVFAFKYVNLRIHTECGKIRTRKLRVWTLFHAVSDCWNAFASFRLAFVSISSFGIILKENEFPNCWFRIAKITAWFLYFSLIFSRESLIFSKSTDECSYWGILRFEMLL